MIGSSKRTAVGIDIGSHSVKIVELEKREDRFRLKNFAIKEIFPSGKVDGGEGPTNDMVTAGIKAALTSIKMKPKRIKQLASSIGGQSVSVKQIKSISLAPEELESSLAFEARKYLPPEETDAVIDFQVLNGDVSTSHMDILLVACTRKMLGQHASFLENAGFKPDIVDVDALATLNAYLLQSPPITDGILIVLNIGARKTNLIVYDPTGLFFTRDITYGGNHFSEDVRVTNKLEPYDAEQHKKDYGIFKAEDAPDVNEITLDGVGLELTRRTTEDNMINEINRSLRYYVKESGRNEFWKVLLTGGSAKILYLDEYLAEKLRIPVEVFDPLASFDLPKGMEDIHPEPQLAQAIGLALRRLQ